MPLISYSCTCGQSTRKFHRVSKDAPGGIPCVCGLEMKKQLSAPSSKNIITIDNGVQGRAVDVNLDTIESNKENSERDFREE